jgi:8-oxo-dGTP pyrophosphatase MutT (NUDIX family)
MIFLKKPANFNSKLEAVGCFVQCDGEIILLHRQNNKPQGDTWGIPSGKIDGEDDARTTMLRELKEETGFEIPENEMLLFKTIFVKYDSYDFIYHIFYTTINNKKKIKLKNDEHKDAKWITPNDALALPLIEDLDGCIKLFSNV